ncbi:MAG: metallophosphoesterase [Paludibacteraceae bacterium]|nr:metallophosphoesterase [Paludibacteraceae bacterium]
MGKKYFVTSDVHSFMDELMVALSEKGFDKDNKDHILCICGDLLDRGDKTVELFEFVKGLQEQDRLIYVRGNHEDLLFDCMAEIYRGTVPGSHHFSNGTIKTICQFCGQSEWIIYDSSWRDKICEIMQPVLDFITENCVDYAEIGDYVLVHGWVPLLMDFRKGTKDDWERARWENGMAKWKNPVCRVEGKTVICGHWHCSYGWSHIDQKYKEFPSPSHRHFKYSFQPWIKDGIIALDACCAYSGKLNCIVIEEDKNEDN